MRKQANKRPYRGGKPRRWREEQKYHNWRRDVFKVWQNECAITGTKNIKDNNGNPVLVAHHLISASSSDKAAYNVKNGIVIHKDLHILFHKNFGYRNNTFSQFKNFLICLLNNEISMPISSQILSAQQSWADNNGSETTVFNTERINKLHEYLSEIEHGINFT